MLRTCRAFPSSPLPRGLHPARIMVSCTSAPWPISRHALHGTVGTHSAVHACVMRALWGGGKGGDWGEPSVKKKPPSCREVLLQGPFLVVMVYPRFSNAASFVL